MITLEAHIKHYSRAKCSELQTHDSCRRIDETKAFPTHDTMEGEQLFSVGTKKHKVRDSSFREIFYST